MELLQLPKVVILNTKLYICTNFIKCTNVKFCIYVRPVHLQFIFIQKIRIHSLVQPLSALSLINFIESFCLNKDRLDTY